MTVKNAVLKQIREEYNRHDDLSGSKLMNKVARNIYPVLPKENDSLLELFDYLVAKDDWKIFWLVTRWIKRKELYRLEYMTYYEEWLYNYVNRWGVCDVFCYRVLNPMVEKYPQLFDNVMRWTDSPKTYIRRAAPVSLLKSTRTFIVNYSIHKVIAVVEKLKYDREDHVKKGVGWLLKYAYLSYPEEVYNYLKKNVDTLDRLIFRYALEKTPSDVKEELMSL